MTERGNDIDLSDAELFVLSSMRGLTNSKEEGIATQDVKAHEPKILSLCFSPCSTTTRPLRNAA